MPINKCCYRDPHSNRNNQYCCPTQCAVDCQTNQPNHMCQPVVQTCKPEYHLTAKSNYTCCYEHEAGGSLKYCCPSQIKAFEENCRPTRIRTTTCQSDWARSFSFYDSRCYLFKISGSGDDYCCPVSSRPGASCWIVGFKSVYRPNSARCFKHKYGEYCCPMSKRW